MIKEFNKLQTDPEGGKILQMQENLILGRHKTFLKSIEKLISSLIQEGDKQMAKFLIKMEIDYLEQCKDKEGDRLIDRHQLLLKLY